MGLMGLLNVIFGLMKLNAKSIVLALTGLAVHSTAQCPDYTGYSQVSIVSVLYFLLFTANAPSRNPREILLTDHWAYLSCDLLQLVGHLTAQLSRWVIVFLLYPNTHIDDNIESYQRHENVTERPRHRSIV